jgi:hypothetical protein
VNQYLKAILAISSLAFSQGLMAESLTDHEYKAAIKNISAEYDSARIDCSALAGHDKSVCMTVAKNQKRAAKNAMQHNNSTTNAQLKSRLAIERYNNLIIDTHLNTKIE